MCINNISRDHRMLCSLDMEECNLCHNNKQTDCHVSDTLQMKV